MVQDTPTLLLESATNETTLSLLKLSPNIETLSLKVHLPFPPSPKPLPSNINMLLRSSIPGLFSYGCGCQGNGNKPPCIRLYLHCTDQLSRTH